MLNLLDMLTIVRLRLVCRMTRAMVEGELQRSQVHILSQYVSDPHGLLHVITSIRALVTAEAALAFFMRDESLLCQDLEICVTSQEFGRLLEYLHSQYVLWPVPDDAETYADTLPERDPHIFLIRDRTRQRRRYIRVIRVCAPLALVGLMRLNNTAMMCMFNADIMCCAYPALTLRRRALIRDLYYSNHWRTGRFDRRRNLLLATRGFVMGAIPARFTEPPLDDVLPWPEFGYDPIWCMGHFGWCSCNTRFIGDMYCLTVFLSATSPVWEYLIDVNPLGNPRLFTWAFPETGTNCIGPHDSTDRDVEFVDGNISGVYIYSIVVNLQPTFLGAHMLGCRQTVSVNVDDWTSYGLTTLAQLFDWHLAMPVGGRMPRYLFNIDQAWWMAGQGFVGPLR